MSIAATAAALRPALPDTPISALPGLLIHAYGQTLLMVGTVMIIVVAFGLPLGILAYNLGPRGLQTFIATDPRTKPMIQPAATVRTAESN